jgi:hypothetical protein
MSNTSSLISASRQVTFHQLLVAARKIWLMDALKEAATDIDQNVLKQQLSQYVPSDIQKILAASGIRDEHVFPTPVLLEAKPTLIGYYRLLLGIAQKSFYDGKTGMSKFKNMEVKGVINERQKNALPDFCKTMSSALSELVRQISPTITQQDIAELPLLILGSQIQGGKNNTIGKQATQDVFLAIAEIVKDHAIERTDKKIIIKNASGRKVVIALSSDPDVRIQEDFDGKLQNKVAIEIKGGTDKSNAHNRAGEAEKSHQKARNDQFRDFWTIITKAGLDMTKLKAESPTTLSWFDAAQVLGRKGDDWDEFRDRIVGAVGIPH